MSDPADPADTPESQSSHNALMVGLIATALVLGIFVVGAFFSPRTDWEVYLVLGIMVVLAAVVASLIMRGSRGSRLLLVNVAIGLGAMGLGAFAVGPLGGAMFLPLVALFVALCCAVATPCFFAVIGISRRVTRRIADD